MYFRPKRPQDKIELADASATFKRDFEKTFNYNPAELESTFDVQEKDFQMSHGNIVVAAITSCTNTSNPSVLIGRIAGKKSD